MRNACDETSNVISVSFPLNRRKSDRDADTDNGMDINEIEHPASKNFADESLFEDDPLEDLFNEFVSTDEQCDKNIREDYIHHHQQKWDFSLSFDQTPQKMGDTLTKQISRLKEDLARFKYYLDEMDID